MAGTLTMRALLLLCTLSAHATGDEPSVPSTPLASATDADGNGIRALGSPRALAKLCRALIRGVSVHALGGSVSAKFAGCYE
mmetsp:Transcript_30436/g.76244  ORF Transcript_30436/g.76244 Transcript_30436/m.76244 type:complete len:82 (+) Transcript_30436:16-261(+)